MLRTTFRIPLCLKESVPFRKPVAIHPMSHSTLQHRVFQAESSHTRLLNMYPQGVLASFPVPVQDDNPKSP